MQFLAANPEIVVGGFLDAFCFTVVFQSTENY